MEGAALPLAFGGALSAGQVCPWVSVCHLCFKTIPASASPELRCGSGFHPSAGWGISVQNPRQRGRAGLPAGEWRRPGNLPQGLPAATKCGVMERWPSCHFQSAGPPWAVPFLIPGWVSDSVTILGHSSSLCHSSVSCWETLNAGK